MTEIAEQEFNLDTKNPNLKINHQDGRSFLNYSQNTYDVILIDAFKGLNAPFELTTYEAMTKAKERLKENGLVITNIISSLEGKDAKFLEHEYATYKKVFDDVKLFKVNSQVEKTTKMNLILIGLKGNPQINDDLKDEYQTLLQNEITNYKTNASISTDDLAPIGN